MFHFMPCKNRNWFYLNSCTKIKASCHRAYYQLCDIHEKQVQFIFKKRFALTASWIEIQSTGRLIFIISDVT